MSTQPDLNKSSEPVLCTNQCGFFGNGELGLCSKCLADHNRKQKEKEDKQSDVVQTTTSLDVVKIEEHKDAKPQEIVEISQESTPEIDSSQPSDLDSKKDEQPKQKKGRCYECNKKTGLLGFECSCGYIFCSQHRHAEDHNCGFDFKTTQRQLLADNNQKVEADKLDRI